jgi:hypothetical protein
MRYIHRNNPSEKCDEYCLDEELLNQLTAQCPGDLSDANFSRTSSSTRGHEVDEVDTGYKDDQYNN